ncbi:nuclear transport factor 2 family protein [Actinomadura barringtoniae]|uniref:Nuclear transport factor 2 family protein n=1 Tax=Actinomadura barringtoniae TaxID=1427535 RepID=A0A939TCB4_9ACTN|nr:nuclear transport factor 2 family protein [Actinomadura barringtoniae]MBO2454387.1 nuclear transport factor 2 family protein [Actinomadura barringtoniae]
MSYEIIETVNRFGWHADRREWDELEAIFTDTVALDYTSLNGGEPAALSPKEIVGAWSQTLGAFDATQHLIANHIVTVDGERAVCTASFQATHRLANPFGSPLWTLGGTYRFDLVKAGENSWKISAVVMTATWADGNKDLLSLASGQ